MMKLNQEEKEALSEILAHPGASVLSRVLDILARDLEGSVLRCNSDDEKTLVLTKAKAEGARQLQRLFTDKVNTLKAKQDA